MTTNKQLRESDKELDRYLSVGIAQTEEERDRYKAECERLRAILSETAAAVGAHADPSCSLEFMSEVPKEVESAAGKLRKDAERYQSLLESVWREIPHREGRRGNAPGHGHSVPGVWDCDNGALAGKKCAWCKVWNEAVSAMEATK